MGSYSKLVIGILVIILLSICVALAIGCWGNINGKKDESYLLNSSFPLNVIERPSGNEDLVSITQKTRFDNVDTEKGKIEVDKEYLPNWTELPLCIKDEDVADYWVTLKVYGGYKPYDGWSITFWQDRDDNKNTKEYAGTINLIPKFLYSTCCYAVYNVTFDVCGPCIQLESNYFPDVPAGWNLIQNCPDVANLNKFVDVKISTHWYGCGLPCQRFEVLLSQNNLFPAPPNSPKIDSR